MKHEIIHLKGLNLRDGDDYAPIGVCRQLMNIFPSGEKEKPIWNPVKQSTLYMANVLYPFVWHRTNLASCIIFKRNVSGNDWILLQEINSTGNPTGGVQSLQNLGTANTNRELRYAQIGDLLIITSVIAQVPEKIWQLNNTGGQTACLPYNLPDLPAVNIYDSQVGTLSGLYGLCYAWLLNDGSYAKFSRIQLIEVSTARLNIELLTPKLVGTDNWNNQISGIIVFISENATKIEDIFDKTFHEILSMTNIWKEVTQTHQLATLTADNIINLPAMRMDVLLQHSLLASEIFSYNKTLLLGDIKYDFENPIFKLSGPNLALWCKCVRAHVAERITNEGFDYTHYNYYASLCWTNRPDAVGNKVESMAYRNTGSNWQIEYNNSRVPIEMLSKHFEFVEDYPGGGSYTVLFRLTTYFLSSRNTYEVITAKRIP
jgi:hypothetical protein